MMCLILNFNNKFWFQILGGTSIRGTAFLNGKCLQGADMMKHLPDTSASNEHWKNFLISLNGFWSIVRKDKNSLIAAVDRIRSIPFFYGQAHDHVYLSDDAEWVRQQVGDKKIDPVAREEFQLAGYVTGQDTLLSNVKQLQAGEMLRITVCGQKPELQTYRYYYFTHTEPEKSEETNLLEELDRVTKASIQRLIEYANGRQIVVPLSGGYDSRLIVTMLKRLEYGNVLTFTYGLPGNKESEYSKKVARALGIEWHFVEYSPEKWSKVWKTKERFNFQYWASGWTSLPHVQDWLAVSDMSAGSFVNKDCIFVPGHTGDFISGGHIPDEASPRYSAKKDRLIHAVSNKHYSLAPWIKFSSKSNEFWFKRIQDLSELKDISNGIELANAYEKWEWQERQAKFICNSVRVYEFFNYNWWMPLWDAELMSFWETVPLKLRKGGNWYIKWVKSLYQNQTGEKNFGNAQKSIFLPIFRKIAKLSGNLLFQQIRKARIRSEIKNHLLCPYARFPEKKVGELIRKGFQLNGIEAYFFLLMMEDKLTLNKKMDNSE